MRLYAEGGYVSMLDPNIFQFQQNLLAKKQQQYDVGYSIALDTKDKYSQFSTRPDDVPVRNQALEQFSSNINDLVKTKYNGDWGRAAKEVASLTTQFKQDPIWETIKYAQDQEKMEDELRARFGPDFLGFNSIKGKSILSPEGKLLSSKELTTGAEERLQDYPVMDRIWNNLAPKSLSGTSIVYKDILGNKVPVIVDATGKEINKDMINKELDNMLKIFKETTPNYDQRVREYTQLSINPETGKNYTMEEAENKIKEDFLAVGMSKQMRQRDENWRPIDPDSITSKGGTTPGADTTTPTYETTYTDKDREEGKKLAKQKASGLGLTGELNLDPNNPADRVALDIMSRPVIADLKKPENVGKIIFSKIDKKSEKLDKGVWLSDDIMGQIGMNAHQIYQDVSNEGSTGAVIGQYGTFNISKLTAANNAKNEYIKSELLKHADYSNSDIRKLTRYITNGYQKANRVYNRAVKAAVDKETDKIGDIGITIHGPNVFVKSGATYKKQLEDMSTQFSPTNYTFIEGKYSQSKYVKGDRKYLDEEYDKNNSKPIIRGFGFDNNIGIVLGVENPDKNVQAAKLENARPELLYRMVIAGGKPEALQADLISKLKHGDNVPDINGKSTSYKVSEGVTPEGGVGRFLYQGDARDENNVTNGIIDQLNPYLVSQGISPLTIPEKADINDPYYFKDPVDLFMVTSILENSIKK